MKRDDLLFMQNQVTDRFLSMHISACNAIDFVLKMDELVERLCILHEMWCLEDGCMRYLGDQHARC